MPRRGTAKAAGAKRQAQPVREDRSKRLLDLVMMLISARAPVPYREIRAKFRAYATEKEDAGLRAFERDKADLLELGVPLRYISAEDDEPIDEAGYVVDLRRYRLPEVHLTADEVAALILAGSVARAAQGTAYAEVVDLAVKKLAFDALPDAPDTPGAPLSSPGGTREPVVVHFPETPEASALADRLAQVEQAIRLRKRLSLTYVTAAHGDARTRTVDPYGLAYRQGAWLLVGHDHLRQELRTFRLDRISGLEVAARPKSPDFERPAGFDVRRHTSRSPWTFAIESPVMAELDIRREAAPVADEDFGDDAAREHRPDGSCRIRFTCANPDHVVTRVLAAKGTIVVIAPDSLRLRVSQELDAVLALYAS